MRNLVYLILGMFLVFEGWDLFAFMCSPPSNLSTEALSALEDLTIFGEITLISFAAAMITLGWRFLARGLKNFDFFDFF